MTDMKNTDVGGVFLSLYNGEQNAISDGTCAPSVDKLSDLLPKAGILRGKLTMRHRGKRSDGLKKTGLPFVG